MLPTNDNPNSPDAIALARSEIERLRIEYQGALRDSLSASLKSNVDGSRSDITERMVDVMRRTFDRQMEEFAHIELQLAMSISQRVSAYYLNVLADKQERLLKMHAAMGSVNDHVSSKADRLRTIEWQEKRLDLLLAIVAIAVPIVFEWFPRIKEWPHVEYAIPIGFACIVVLLTGLKFILFRARKSEAATLLQFVTQKHELASSLLKELTTVSSASPGAWSVEAQAEGSPNKALQPTAEKRGG